MKLSQLFQELAKPNKFSKVLEILPDPDPVLTKLGKSYSTYRKFEDDYQVWTCINSRKAGVKSLEWEIQPGEASNQCFEFIKDLFENEIDIYDIISQILDAPFYGNSPIEIVWKKESGYIIPARIEEKPQEWFVFDDNRKLYFNQNNKRIEIPEYKILYVVHEPKFRNPYGVKLFSKIFWPWTFKKGGYKFWMLFLEKFGIPWVLGKLPRGKPQEEYDDLFNMLSQLVEDSVAVIPDDSSVEIKEIEQKSGSSAYETLIKLADNAIAKVILGQTLTTDIGNKGSYAAGKVHYLVRKDIVDSDKKLVEKTINKLIKWIVDINFDSKPPKFYLYEEEDVDKKLAERDEILSRIGVKFTKEYFIKNYGFAEEDIEVLGSQFAEKTYFRDDPILEYISNKTSQPAFLQNLSEKVLKSTINMIKGGLSYTEIFEKIAIEYPNLDTDEIEAILNRAIYMAEISSMK